MGAHGSTAQSAQEHALGAGLLASPAMLGHMQNGRPQQPSDGPPHKAWSWTACGRCNREQHTRAACVRHHTHCDCHGRVGAQQLQPRAECGVKGCHSRAGRAPCPGARTAAARTSGCCTARRRSSTPARARASSTSQPALRAAPALFYCLPACLVWHLQARPQRREHKAADRGPSTSKLVIRVSKRARLRASQDGAGSPGMTAHSSPDTAV